MKKIIFIFLLIPFALKAQVNRVMLPGVISIVTPPSAQTAKLTFTQTGSDPTSPGWYSAYIGSIGSPQSIKNTSGVASGWSVQPGGANTPSEFTQSSGDSNANFPVDAIVPFWYNSTGSFTVVISGLDNSKTYSIRIGSRFGGGNRASYTINGSTQTMAADFSDILFTAQSPTSGVITITVGLVNAFAFINAIQIIGKINIPFNMIYKQYAVKPKTIQLNNLTQQYQTAA